MMTRRDDDTPAEIKRAMSRPPKVEHSQDDGGTNWVRVTYVAAIAGAVFWAATVRVVEAVTTDSPLPLPLLVLGVFVAAAVVMGVALIVNRRAASTKVRSTAAGLIVAPLTGVVVVVSWTLVGLIGSSLFR